MFKSLPAAVVNVPPAAVAKLVAPVAVPLISRLPVRVVLPTRSVVPVTCKPLPAPDCVISSPSIGAISGDVEGAAHPVEGGTTRIKVVYDFGCRTTTR